MQVVRMEECSEYVGSGCESGWTMYLDQSEDQHGSLPQQYKFGLQQEEEDLSMVSDASSGPPHFPDDDILSSALAKKGGKRRRVDGEQKKLKQREELCGFLDDTASSPLIAFPKKNVNLTSTKNPHQCKVLDMSYGFSATHFKAKTTLDKPLGYLKQSTAEPRETNGKNKIW